MTQYPAGYPQPMQPYPPMPPATNGLAIASLVTSLLGMAIIPIVLGHIALKQIKERAEGGQVMAIIGLVLGYLQLAGYLLLVLLFGLGILASIVQS